MRSTRPVDQYQPGRHQSDSRGKSRRQRVTAAPGGRRQATEQRVRNEKADIRLAENFFISANQMTKEVTLTTQTD